MLITRAALPDGRTVDIRCTDTLTAVAQRLDPRPGEDLLDAAGALVLPGLHDHHSHLRRPSPGSCVPSLPVRGAV
ncbi:hypothetical protein H7H37_18765 [Mycolicibacterium insubricum]|nr:hypothetical protein [Mycolicibacterium insubricum]